MSTNSRPGKGGRANRVATPPDQDENDVFGPEPAADVGPDEFEFLGNGKLRDPQPAGESPDFAPAPDPFSPESLRQTQDPAAGLGLRKVLASVPIRKPDKCWFVRTHPDRQRFWFQTGVIEWDRELWLVPKAMWKDLEAQPLFKWKLFVTAVTRQNNPFIWVLSVPRADGRVDDWTRSAQEAADLATRSWVRVAADMALGAYDLTIADGITDDPQWPTQSFEELWRIAWRGRCIDNPEHFVLKQMRGEV